MAIRYKSEMSWFQTVYLKTDLEQSPWQIVGVLLSPNGPMYTITQSGETIDVFEGEFSTEVNTELKLGLENNID